MAADVPQEMVGEKSHPAAVVKDAGHLGEFIQILPGKGGLNVFRQLLLVAIHGGPAVSTQHIKEGAGIVGAHVDGISQVVVKFLEMVKAQVAAKP